MDRHSQQLLIGGLFLALAAFALVSGTAVSISRSSGFKIYRRRDNRRRYWFAVATAVIVGLAGVALGAGWLS